MGQVTLFDINTPASQIPAGVTTSVGDYDTLNESIAKAAIKIKYINIYSTDAAQVKAIYQWLKKDVFGNECLYYEIPAIDPNQRQQTTLNVIPARDIILDGTLYMTFDFATDVRITFYWEQILADTKQLGKSDAQCEECFETINAPGDNPNGTESFFYVNVSTSGVGSVVLNNFSFLTLNNGALLLLNDTD